MKKTTSVRESRGLDERMDSAFEYYQDNAYLLIKGPAAFIDADSPTSLLALCAITNSSPFQELVSLQLAREEQSFEVGVIERTPVPEFAKELEERLAMLAHRAWSLMRLLDSVVETSHAFALPRALLQRVVDYDVDMIINEIKQIRAEVDHIASDGYAFREEDAAATSSHGSISDATLEAGDKADESEGAEREESDILSWCVGVAFGRFDWSPAIGDRKAPPEPDPFDLLPAKSPGMLPDGAVPFHAQPGILVDDPGHPHDLPRVIDDVLTAVDYPAPEDVRRWLQRDFFAYHLRQYSKSRRKAPIYWPLSTPSGGYTLWFYYPALTDQTLYTAANDFVGPKLEETSRLASGLRTSTSRSRGEERQLEQLQDLETELKELQDELLRLAPPGSPTTTTASRSPRPRSGAYFGTVLGRPC
jgi:hypothetical protein